MKTKYAFTLIELMIVVVILWVLMSTILPKLLWWQARSRDAWRIADLRNIVWALNTFYDDNWDYPWKQWKAYCLPKNWNSSDSDFSATYVSWVLSLYLQSKLVPIDPNQWSNSLLCNPDGIWKYYYAPLLWNWLNKNSYLLCADMEDYHNANLSVTKDLVVTNWIEQTWINYNALALKSLKSWNDSVKKLYETMKERKFTAESVDWAADSVYCMIRTE